MTCTYRAFCNESRFDDLVESVRHCDLCSRLCERTKVLSGANGNVNSKVLFIAEAPGRLGADRTGVPLHGDRTGDNFDALLGNIAWSREDVFITNAVLCNPREENGNNATPTAEEIANCSAYLGMVVNLVEPDIIATLGAKALKALEFISPHGIELKEGVGCLVPWMRSRLFPLYHPAPRAAIHRSLAKQRTDFMRLAKIVHPIGGVREAKRPPKERRTVLPPGASSLQQVACAMLCLGGRMTYFKLTKLLYFVDLLSIRRLGHVAASEVYLRQVDGPWPPKLDEALTAMDGYEVRRYFARRLPMVAPGPAPRFDVQLAPEVLEIITEVHGEYGHLSNSGIKTAVYRTGPMRHILGEEAKGRDMRNKAVLYRDKTAEDLHEEQNP